MYSVQNLKGLCLNTIIFFLTKVFLLLIMATVAEIIVLVITMIIIIVITINNYVFLCVIKGKSIIDGEY